MSAQASEERRGHRRPAFGSGRSLLFIPLRASRVSHQIGSCEGCADGQRRYSVPPHSPSLQSETRWCVQISTGFDTSTFASFASAAMMVRSVVRSRSPRGLSRGSAVGAWTGTCCRMNASSAGRRTTKDAPLWELRLRSRRETGLTPHVGRDLADEDRPARPKRRLGHLSSTYSPAR